MRNSLIVQNTEEIAISLSQYTANHILAFSKEANSCKHFISGQCRVTHSYIHLHRTYTHKSIYWNCSAPTFMVISNKYCCLQNICLNKPLQGEGLGPYMCIVGQTDSTLLHWVLPLLKHFLDREISVLVLHLTLQNGTAIVQQIVRVVLWMNSCKPNSCCKKVF